MQTDAPFWRSLVFEGIDDVEVEAVAASFGTVEEGREAGRPRRRVRIAAVSRIGSTTVTSAD
ncbi:hypothetical protein ACFQ8C_12320 [Streptomyces sp. NPDC056503]|uniref:hypothetical protein n=1 Tax=Streptomyces sp. NPDC056503 TaxID=3345842 RepID=UPI003685E42F